ncbi:MAG: ribonuclease HI [Eggerthellaceae bacterium]|nr:ribonuclease HI [Eggerthellaceae bacterium]
MQEVQIFSDGSARGNPGNGGFGALLRYVDANGAAHERELSEGFEMTTNNRMELLGVIRAFQALKHPCRVFVQTDSKYVVDAFNKDWISGWKRRGWKNAKKDPVANRDLWEELLHAIEGHEVTFSWIKGHAGHSENERCDALATAAADGKHLSVDEGYVGSA